MERSKLKDPVKQRARALVYHHVKQGNLPPPGAFFCSNIECIRDAEQYHHWSYAPENKLSVIPLCRRCHRRIHGVTILTVDEEKYAVTLDNWRVRLQQQLREFETGQKHENDYDFDDDLNEIVIPIPCDPKVYARLLTIA